MNAKMYSVAIRRRLNDKDHFWQHDDYEFVDCKIDTCNGRYWYADPFVYEKDGVVYLFFEALDLVQVKGILGYCILREDGTCTKPKMIIEEHCHLSFPYIFEHEGSIYIMPEMCGDYSLTLFKAISFPDKWEKTIAVLPDVYACDSIFIEKGCERYLLTNEMYHHVPHGQYASCWVKNYLYSMDGLKVLDHGTWVAEGDYGIRNAGKSFVEDGIVYRIGQDCRDKKYGRGLVLFKVSSLMPYSEEEVWSATCDDITCHIKRNSENRLLGVHTYNFSEHFEIIDYSEMRHLAFRYVITRKIDLIRRGWKKIVSYL